MSKLEVAIIGAGIAGLAAAIALGEQGHHVEIFEKSSFRNEIGAAITITPNGNRILDAWHFDYDKAENTDKQQLRRVAFDSLDVIAKYDLSYIPQLYGSRFNAFHRVDLHTQLRKLVKHATFRLGCEVQDIHCEEGIITLKDGSQIKKDLIVIADGIKSRFVSHINGADVPRTFTGMSVHRTLIDMETLMKNPTVRPLLEGEPSGFLNTISPSGIMVVTYPCRADRVLNTAVFHKSKPTETKGDDWNAPADINDVLSLMEGFNPVWAEIFKCAKEWKCFPVSKRDPLDHLYRGKAVIIGDAAHACLPTHAQGGSMALEDAAALGVLFAQPCDVTARLELYEKLRMPRSTTTQLLSNAMMYHRDGEETVRHIRQFYQGELPIGAESWSRQITDFFYGYDIFAQAEKAIRGEELQYFGTTTAA